MITIHTSLLSDNLGFNGEDIQVKSVSAAWNKIREIRDTTEAHILNGTLLKVSADEGIDLSRIPETILFRLNAKGKMEFKDYAKVEARKAKEEKMKEEASAE